MKTCSLVGCPGVAKSRGMCQAHYCRWRKTGDPGPVEVKRRRRAKSERIPNRRDRRLRSVYGISLDQYDARLAEQGGLCAVCGRGDSGERYESFHVDHDHVTGVVRGLLCGPCNKGIGMLGDDPERLMAAVAYLLSRVDILNEVPL